MIYILFEKGRIRLIRSRAIKLQLKIKLNNLKYRKLAASKFILLMQSFFGISNTPCF